jgi:hypothetical protein
MFMKFPLLMTVHLFLLACAMTGSAAVEVFTEDFEQPDVNEISEPKFTSETVPDSWVVGPLNQELRKLVYGSERQGIVDATNGAFSGYGGNQQAYAFRYTASPQIVSSRSAFDLSLEEGSVYTLSFDVQQDLNDNEDPSRALGYDAYLIAFDSGASRGRDVRVQERNPVEKDHHILAQTTGSVPSGGSFTRITLSYTGEYADRAHFGKDIGIAFKDLWIGDEDRDISSGVIDNVKLTVDRIPEPSALLPVALALGFGLLRRRSRVI